MSERAVKSPVFVDKHGKTTSPEIKRIESEKWLQKFLPTCPDILPVSDIELSVLHTVQVYDVQPAPRQ